MRHGCFNYAVTALIKCQIKKVILVVKLFHR